MSAGVIAVTLASSFGVGVAAADGKGIHGGIHHRGFSGTPGLRGNGFGYGGLIAYSDPGATAEVPAVLTVPQPAPAVVAVDLPPCRETTTEGVVIARGTSCAHTAP
jgi:hypothetical protein